MSTKVIDINSKASHAKVTKTVTPLVKPFDQMAQRWSEEGQYEDFTEYRAYAKKFVEATGAVFISLTRRPFQLVVERDGFRVFVTATRNQITTKFRMAVKS